MKHDAASGVSLAHSLIAKIPRTRHWRVTLYGRGVTGAAVYVRNHDLPAAYCTIAHDFPSYDAKKSGIKNLSAVEICVFGAINDTHAACDEFFCDAVVRDGLADHGEPSTGSARIAVKNT